MDSVYILVNKDMPGLIKIGRTSGPASERAKKLSQSTSVPSPFEVAYEIPCDQPKQLERTMHHQLAQYRRPRREFFECSVEYAISLLEHYHLDILNNHPWNQTAKELLLELPDDEKEFNSGEPYNQIVSAELCVLQLMDWGLNSGNEEMQEWRERERRYTYLSDMDMKLIEFRLDMNPYHIMKYLMTDPAADPDSDFFPPEMYDFERIWEPHVGAITLLTSLIDIMKHHGETCTKTMGGVW